MRLGNHAFRFNINTSNHYRENLCHYCEVSEKVLCQFLVPLEIGEHLFLGIVKCVRKCYSVKQLVKIEKRLFLYKGFVLYLFSFRRSWGVCLWIMACERYCAVVKAHSITTTRVWLSTVNLCPLTANSCVVGPTTCARAQNGTKDQNIVKHPLDELCTFFYIQFWSLYFISWQLPYKIVFWYLPTLLSILHDNMYKQHNVYFVVVVVKSRIS